jgi:4-hydroxy-3-polyprenylbenzoate decarboxylase
MPTRKRMHAGLMEKKGSAKEMATPLKKLIVGISGASGVIYGLEMLHILKGLGYESHLVLTGAAKKNILIETNQPIRAVEKAASHVYDEEDLTAPIASGSFLTHGMVVIPCSIKTLSGIANSYNSNLLVRAADVTIKERRPLILVVRETPLHQGHLKLMLAAASMGAVILPPVPAFYHHPQNILDLIHHTIGKVLDGLQIPNQLVQRWGAE